MTNKNMKPEESAAVFLLIAAVVLGAVMLMSGFDQKSTDRSIKREQPSYDHPYKVVTPEVKMVIFRNKWSGEQITMKEETSAAMRMLYPAADWEIIPVR